MKERFIIISISWFVIVKAFGLAIIINLYKRDPVMDLQTIQCTTTLAKWRTIKDNVNSIDFFYFIYSCLHLHEIKKKPYICNTLLRFVNYTWNILKTMCTLLRNYFFFSMIEGSLDYPDEDFLEWKIFVKQKYEYHTIYEWQAKSPSATKELIRKSAKMLSCNFSESCFAMWYL